jgi:hypothetical protein
LLETELDRQQREYLGMAKSSAHALLGLINDILDFSRIEAGKLELEAISFSLRDCIGTMLKPLGMRAEQKGLRAHRRHSRGKPHGLMRGGAGSRRSFAIWLFTPSLPAYSTRRLITSLVTMSVMASTEIRHTQLSHLADALRDLVGTLAQDHSCQWTTHFRRCLAHAEELLSTGFTQEQLAELSASVTHCYGGMGSFSDYAPTRYDSSTGRYTGIPGTETFETFAGATYERALALRVTGQR